MVMPLPLPGSCSIKLVGQIVDERQNGVNAVYFEGIRQEWMSRAEIYMQHHGSPEHVPQWLAIPPKRKTSFLNLYLHPDENSVHGVMLTTLRDYNLTLCPACGEMGRPNTLDHYLPKSLFPHFCVTPANLFPMCDACQGKKLEKTGTAAEPRFFLHPYFDVFIAEQVLKVTIEPPFAAPAFRIGISNHLDPAQRTVVVSHVRELAIEQRFAHYFKEANMRMLRLVHALRQGGIPVEATLHSFEQAQRMPSLNSWEHIYIEAVISNPAMMDYLIKGDLPEYL